MGKIEETLNKLNIEDKIRLTYGSSYWKSSSVDNLIHKKIITDGPHGIRLQEHDLGKMLIYESYKSYAYPSLSLLANSFDPHLLKEVGYMIGLEANSMGVSMVLGPGVNIKRHPRNGRAFEYFSEDPLVSGRLAYEYIRGVEKAGVGACVKHFFANSQEKNRLISNSVIDQRTLHELYLSPFDIALKAKPSAVMASYNRVNGKFMAENKLYLNTYLRHEQKFKGFVISDWGAVSNPINSLKMGLNLEMPGSDFSRNAFIYDAYLNNEISERDINKALKPVLKFLLKENKKKKFDAIKCEKLILKAAEESAVLLKNNNFLPIKKKDKVLIVGGFFNNPRYGGSGSSKVNPIKIVNGNEAFKKSKFFYEFVEGFDTYGHITDLSKALEKAKAFDKVLVFTGLPVDKESEGVDRNTLNLPNDYVLAIKELAKVNSNIGVILECGCVTNVKDYINKVDAILYAGLAGSMSGVAIFNIISGKVSPCGKLAESYVSEEDTYLGSSYPSKDLNIKYTEGLYVGYPYYYINNITPSFSFGHGLTYAKFSYNAIENNKKILIDITNKSTSSKEILFLFVRDSRNYIRLKDFAKVMVKRNSSNKIEFEIKDEYFKFYDEESKRFVLGSGKFDVLIGTSIDNIIYKKSVSIKGEKKYLHPEFDLQLTRGLFRNSGPSQNSTLHDLEKYPHFDELKERLLGDEDNGSVTDPFLRAQILGTYSENPVRFNTLYVDKNFSIYEMYGYISLLKGDNEKAKYFFERKNNLLNKDKK